MVSNSNSNSDGDSNSNSNTIGNSRYARVWLKMIGYMWIWVDIDDKGRSLGGSFWVKSHGLDESGEGTTHDHRSLRTQAATGTDWALKAD